MTKEKENIWIKGIEEEYLRLRKNGMDGEKQAELNGIMYGYKQGKEEASLTKMQDMINTRLDVIITLMTKVNQINITREWAMPNLRTFQIKPIEYIINKYKKEGNWIDPFPYPYKIDALEFLSEIKDNSVDGVLFDPPYSPRQLKECYDNQGLVLHDTKSSVWKSWKDEIARVIKPNGLCLSFGWSTNGLGKERGFEIIEILLVAHGGNHNDTIVTIERKIKLGGKSI